MKTGTDNYVVLSFKSLGENVALARLVISSLVSGYDLTLVELDEIKVAVSEAVSNCIIHGYLNAPEHTVEVRGELCADLLTVTVKDQGVGISDVKKAMEANYSRIADRMGLGFTFMQSFMDKVEVVSKPGEGTTVILSKKLEAVANQAISEIELNQHKQDEIDKVG